METCCSETAASHGEDHCSCLHRPGKLWSGISIRPSFPFVFYLASSLIASQYGCRHPLDSIPFEISMHTDGATYCLAMSTSRCEIFRFSKRCCWRFKTWDVTLCSVFNDGSASVFRAKQSNERIHVGLICIPLLLPISARCHHSYRIIALVHYARVTKFADYIVRYW